MENIISLSKDFYEVTGRRLSNSSILKLFNIVMDRINETTYLNIFNSYSINEDAINDAYFYEVYIVEENDWWENIAYKQYENPQLWWIIAMVNNINNPFEELSPGDRLKIIRKEYLYNILKEISEIGNEKIR